MRYKQTVMVLLAVFLGGCEGRQHAWEEASGADTVPAYEEYLDEYPDSPEADRARSRLTNLRREAAWEQAREADSIEAYQAFLAQFPESSQAPQARDEIEARQAWQALPPENKDALADFTQRFSGHPLAARAERQIETLEQTEADAREQAYREEERRRAEIEARRTHRVQLAAYRDSEAAQDGSRLLTRRLASTLGGVNLEVQRAGNYHLLRTEPLEENRARALCRNLQAKDQECLVVSR